MSKVAIETLRQTILDKYCLRKSGSNWVLEEPRRKGKTKQQVTLHAVGCDSFGFSVDPSRYPRPPFALFSGAPSRNITLMCDAFVAVCRRDELFWFVIEMQTTAKTKKYEKQLANGKIFCDWLAALLKEHGYLANEPRYFGLLVLPPRKMPNKGATSHQHAKLAPLIAKSPKQPFDIYEAKNRPDIDLMEFIPQK